VDAQQVGLLDAPHLDLDADHERTEADQARRIRHQQCEAGGGHDHPGEDGVAHEPERAVRAQCSALARIHAHAPRAAHRELRMERARDAGDREQ
jgi:hypothetical protein